MFLEHEFKKPNNYSFLTEAEDDENNEANPENQTGDEPTEGDADMEGGDESQDLEDAMGGEGEEGFGEEGDDGMGGDVTTSDEAGDDDTKSNPLEGMKKKKLLKDYRNLMNLYDDTINSLSYINYSALSPNEKKIFNYIEKRIKVAEENIDIVVKDEYEVISYPRLLKLFIYFKLQLKTFADIVKEFIKE